MFLNVYKQTFWKLYGYVTREFLGLRKRNFQGSIFIWTRTYREIFKFALEKNKLIYSLQFGFKQNYSTSYALIHHIETIKQSIDQGLFSCGIFFDLQKAFDTVDHGILPGKLDHYGIRGITNKWF